MAGAATFKPLLHSVPVRRQTSQRGDSQILRPSICLSTSLKVLWLTWILQVIIDYLLHFPTVSLRFCNHGFVLPARHLRNTAGALMSLDFSLTMNRSQKESENVPGDFSPG